jgi:hypothetical protein
MVTKDKNITSYHIDLDISRAEDNNESNKNSYVYLKMTKDADMLFGKTISAKENNIKLGSNIEIIYNNVILDEYCDSVREYAIEEKGNEEQFSSTFFTVDKDNKKYYGTFGFILIETQDNGDNKITIGGDRRQPTKVYTKSMKRLLYGKRKMVIYVGKRGGEYVKVKGEYISLTKFSKKMSKNK